MSLVAVLYDQIVGVVTNDGGGRPSLEYDAAWRAGVRSLPLSLSLPLRHLRHATPAVAAYLWGLLPDNDLVLDRWARRFGTTAGSVMGLLAHVGEDCAGAVRFVREERLATLPNEGEGQVKWLSEADVAQRLRELRADASLGRRPDDEGQFSLAGAQAKTALFERAGRWGLPSGRMPTTHILKPPLSGLDGHVENEHFCLSLAHAVGLPTASSTVASFEDERAIAVQRFDRVSSDGGILRVHQEDACQALGVLPSRKYQNEGGPGPFDIVTLIREHSREADADVTTFVDALAFNWLIAGTDAHAKNYSLLLGAGGRVRLAPLYDLASALPYSSIDRRKAKLAMRIGGKYRLHEIGARQWEKLASELHLDAATLRERLLDLSQRTSVAAYDVLQKAHSDGLDHPILEQLASTVAQRASDCARQFGA